MANSRGNIFCYNCGCQLSEHDFCTACGADVSQYKKIMYAANRLYNEGLERARVRDLTGAIGSLRQSLKFNKNKIEARNLLGLVYFEMGEVVAALSQWVLSKNTRPEKNIADDYIETVHANASRLETLSQSIRKYNQAYTYCTQDSKDLAIIQLKKVLSLNPKFVRAHLLLALLYMDSEQWDRADKEIRKCLKIDHNNTQALRYLQEVEMMMAPDDSSRQTAKRRKEESVRYQSDNEIIIQPLNVKEQKSGAMSAIVNMIIGLIIGLAAMYFLVVPAKVAEVNNDVQGTIKRINEQLDAKTVNIQELEAQVSRLEADNESLSSQLEEYVGTEGALSTMDNLLAAANIYLETQDVTQTAENLESIAQSVDLEQTSEAFQNLYNTLLGTIGPDLANAYFKQGETAFNSGDYAAAVEGFSRAVYYDAGNMEALYNLGHAYRRNGDRDEAIATYDKVTELFPNTLTARKAQEWKKEIAPE